MKAALSNDPIRLIYKQIAQLVEAAERGNAEARHKAAALIHEVLEDNGAKYGRNAARTLANSMGISKSKLYEYAGVYNAWPNGESFSQMLRKRNKAGRCLTWSHLVLIASVQSVSQRDELAATVLEKDWSVRDLRSNLQNAKRPEMDAGTERTTSTTFGQLAKKFLVQVIALASNARVFSESFLEAVREADMADLSDDLFDQVKDARKQLTDCLTELDRCTKEAEKRRRHIAEEQDQWNEPAQRDDRRTAKKLALAVQ